MTSEITVIFLSHFEYSLKGALIKFNFTMSDFIDFPLQILLLFKMIEVEVTQIDETYKNLMNDFN